jgi:hypothetical protein
MLTPDPIHLRDVESLPCRGDRTTTFKGRLYAFVSEKTKLDLPEPVTSAFDYLIMDYRVD